MIAIDSDNTVSVERLRDTVNGVYLNDATVTCMLLDSDLLPVTSFNLTYVADTNGTYRGLLTAAVTGTLVVGETYTIQITANSLSGIKLVDRQAHKASYA